MQDGKALQAGTSHDLGQNFAKSIGIKFQGRDGSEQFAHTTSWGISTRLIGGIIMAHGDDDGMIMPPRIAPHHVVVIPIVRDDSNSAALIDYAHKLRARLKEKGIRVHVDDTDERTPNKMWSAIKRGVPIRVEIGGREMDEGTLTYVRRDIGKDSKKTVSIDEFVNSVQAVLDDMHKNIFEKARAMRDGSITDVGSLKEAEEFYKANKFGFVRFDTKLLKDPSFEKIKGEHSLTARCMPLADGGKTVIVGKAY